MHINIQTVHACTHKLLWLLTTQTVTVTRSRRPGPMICWHSTFMTTQYDAPSLCLVQSAHASCMPAYACTHPCTLRDMQPTCHPLMCMHVTHTIQLTGTEVM